MMNSTEPCTPLGEPAPLVLMLTDTATLTDVRPLAKRGAAPTLFSLTLDTTGTLRGMIATERQLVGMRDLLDTAIDRMRQIEGRARWGADQ